MTCKEKPAKVQAYFDLAMGRLRISFAFLPRGLGMRLAFFLLFVVFNQSVTSFARNQKLKFERLSLEQGLSQSVVTCIVQDRQGFMWFGTMDGLNKYDGYEFVVYKHDPLDSTSLANNHITALYVDVSGALWIGTPEGLHRFDRIRERFIRFQHNSNNVHSLSHNAVTALTAEGNQNRLWVGTAEGGLNLLDPQTGGMVTFKNDSQNSTSLPGNHVQALVVDRTGALWVGTWHGLARLEHLSADAGMASFTRFQHDPNNPRSLSSNVIWSIHEDSRNSGTLWITTFGGGINRFDRASTLR